MIPAKIDRYDVKAEIGRGGMATVYEAYDPIFERTVAVKVLPREFLHEPEFRARFTREAKVIAGLEHPAIVPVYDFGEDNGQPFLVMRYMRGGSLADRLQKGPIPIDETAEILKRLGSALDRAHEQGIIHRDLKPSNVLFDEYSDAYLADFGIVRLASSSEALTASGSLVGTPTYMSPEQVYGDKQLDGRSDIYALGVILFQMLTGQTPYEADTPARLMMKHVMDPVPHVKDRRPDLPDEFDDIINRAMAKEPAERFPKASELSSALTAVTKRSDKDELAAELAAVQTELQAEPPRIQTPAPFPVDGKPEATEFPGAPAGGRVQIPLWVWALAGMLLLVCAAGVGGGAWLLSRNGVTLSGAATATIGGVSAEEMAAGSTRAALSVTRTAGAALPTDTPATAVTNTPTSSPAAVDATPTTGADLAATRASLAATRDAVEAPTPTAASFAPLFGPQRGALPHSLDGIIQSAYAGVSLADFYAEVTFLNPYGPDVGSWDMGITFRQAELNDELRLVIRSSGSWNLNRRLEDDDNFLQEGTVGDLLDTTANGRNHLRLLVLDAAGYFFLNDTLVEVLDLSALDEEGNIAIGTGFYTSNMREGETTAYEEFTVWPLTAVYGPESGELEHVDDSFIKTSYADVETANFIAQAVFTNPYSAETGSWDVGLAFREVSDGNQYWLVLDSEPEWVLVSRTDGEDAFVNDGSLAALDLTANGQNVLTLIAQNERGYLLVNGEFVATLDLSERTEAGAAAVFTAFFVGNEIEGSITAFDDFTIWELP